MIKRFLIALSVATVAVAAYAEPPLDDALGCLVRCLDRGVDKADCEFICNG